MTVNKVVIPAAGLGTRLLSATKEQPKEMLPIFSRTINNELCLKPVVQIIFEQLFDHGFRDFFFIVGKSKRAIEDHFTPDYEFVNSLTKTGKHSYAAELTNFYRKLSESNIVWINQHAPLGFGHAVLLVKNLIKDEGFMVHAGDTIISSQDNLHIRTLIDNHRTLKASSTLLVRDVPHPQQFGIVEGLQEGRIIEVKKVEEKPSNPQSNLAIMPLYIFENDIFDALEKISPGKGNEIQLTDGIMRLIQTEKKVVAVKMNPKDQWVDVGTPITYWEALSISYSNASSSDRPTAIY